MVNELPGAKFLVAMREPVFHAQSLYNFMYHYPADYKLGDTFDRPAKPNFQQFLRGATWNDFSLALAFQAIQLLQNVCPWLCDRHNGCNESSFPHVGPRGKKRERRK
eukprot:gnl/TRDRNA2_/TRDRNA2_161350_c1_seq4.p1 gnl/TRDRNA2_/TRDRNA2_161350_c1~~gnl/TRDRNA2_/TRDRNA2_161350_c1_seq4.p1  ORF type:complete len:107 (-),score=5.33 gnl/TRDRNA2_/TRDRNA2_161350_c1_seq4:13-333(-)